MGQENSQPVAECDARTVADPDLYIRGGGGGHPDPEIRGDPVLVWSKNRGGVDPRAPPLDPPLKNVPDITTGSRLETHNTVYAFSFIRAANSKSQINLLRSRSLCR